MTKTETTIVNRLIELARDGERADKEAKDLKAKIRDCATKARNKSGENQIEYKGHGGIVAVVFGQAERLKANTDEVLKTCGDAAYRVLQIDDDPRVTLPKDWRERLAKEDAKVRAAIEKLVEVKETTPRVVVNVLS